MMNLDIRRLDSKLKLDFLDSRNVGMKLIFLSWRSKIVMKRNRKR